MAFVPVSWQSNEVITVEKLNKLDNGWGVSKVKKVLFADVIDYTSHNYTLELLGNLSHEINAEAIVFWNDLEYDLICFDDDGYPTYGAPYDDYSDRPFCIYWDPSTESWKLAAKVSGRYTLKIEAFVDVIEVSEVFKAAVLKCLEDHDRTGG